MIRPPPLQLKLDNRFPQPVRTPSQPKPKSFVAQLYKASWKNPIIALAGLNGLRYAFACYNAFGDALVDEEEGAENLFVVSLALCAMYFIPFVIEIYGIVGVSIQRFGFIRAYLYLTLLASLLVTAAGVLKGVSYFTFADELVWQCVTLATEGRGWQKSLFRGRPWPGSVVPYPERLAEKQCTYAWVHHSWNHIAAVFLFNLIPAVIHYILVYTYYRQTVDPSHHANLLDNRRAAGGSPAVARRADRGGYARVDTEERDSEMGMTTSRAPVLTPRQRRAAQQAPYAQRHNAAVAGPSHASGSSSRITAASSSYTGVKRTYTPRGIKRSRCPPPLMQSPSPLGLNVGPAEFNNNRGRSRVYAAFAAPVESSQYDKFV